MQSATSSSQNNFSPQNLQLFSSMSQLPTSYWNNKPYTPWQPQSQGQAPAMQQPSSSVALPSPTAVSGQSGNMNQDQINQLAGVPAANTTTPTSSTATPAAPSVTGNTNTTLADANIAAGLPAGGQAVPQPTLTPDQARAQITPPAPAPAPAPAAATGAPLMLAKQNAILGPNGNSQTSLQSGTKYIDANGSTRIAVSGQTIRYESANGILTTAVVP